MTDYRSYRAVEAAANRRADELLAGTGRTLATMTAQDYARVKSTLVAEKLWHGGNPLNFAS